MDGLIEITIFNITFLMLAFKIHRDMTLKKKKLKKKIILSSKAAGGKDFFRAFLISRGFRPSISQTTREPRKGEVDGKDYHFMEKKDFMEMVAGNQFHEHVCFQGNHYGTTEHSFNNDDIFIFTPGGLSQLSAEERKGFVVIYLDAPLDVRVERMQGRVNADKISERLEKDDKEFFGFKDYDIRVRNPYFKPETLLKTIENYCEI